MKYFYYVITKKNEEDKYYSYAERISGCNNILTLVKKNVVNITAFSTFKEAKEIAKFWNNTYKFNGTYMFE